MKFVSEIPVNKEFEPEKEGWSALKEPDIIMAQLIALPIGILAAMGTFYLANFLGVADTYRIHLGFNLLIAFIVIVPIHEFFHALLFPGKLSSEHVYFGFLPKALVFFAYYDKEMSRNRFLLVFIAPFIVLSIFPLFFMMITGIEMSFLIDIAIINALSACVDLLGMILLASQVPAKATVRNKGFKTYWKV